MLPPFSVCCASIYEGRWHGEGSPQEIGLSSSQRCVLDLPEGRNAEERGDKEEEPGALKEEEEVATSAGVAAGEGLVGVGWARGGEG